MKPTLALSTCWNSFRHQDGYRMLREIADLGFTHAELSHGVKLILVPGILKAVEEGVIQISSTHNFCPLPASVSYSAPNFYEPSAGDPRELEQWVRYTKRSIDFAAQVKAGVCVLHLGSVRFWFFPPSRALLKVHARRVESGVPPSSDAAYQQALKKACVRLEKAKSPFWERTLKSLQSVLNYACERGIALGCENREKFEELPLDGDFPALFEALGEGAPVGYWHDTGHADIKASLGLLDHREHLEKNAGRLLGFHLHDVNEQGKDHQPVGAGRIDFEMVSGFWRPHHRLTLELSPRCTPDEVRASRDRVRELAVRQFGG